MADGFRFPGEALQENPKFWELIESAKSSAKA